MWWWKKPENKFIGEIKIKLIYTEGTTKSDLHYRILFKMSDDAFYDITVIYSNISNKMLTLSFF